MSQPPSPYDRQYNFTDFQSANPTTPLPGQKVDQELNAARTAINATISRLGEVQADDGKVRNSALNLTTIAEAITPLLSQAPVQAVNAAGASQVAAVNAAGSTQISAVNAAAAAGQALIAAETTTSNATIILSAQATATTAAQNASASATSAQINADLAYQRYVQANNAVIAAQNAEMAAEGAAASAVTASSSASSSAAIATTEASTANHNQLLAETHMMAALAAKAEAEAAANTAQTIVNNGAAAITAQVQPFLDDAAASATSAHNSANDALASKTVAQSSATAAASSATSAAASAAAASTFNPANFAPVSHTHPVGDITGLASALTGYATQSWVNGQGFAYQSDWRLTAVQNSSFIDLNNAATSGSYDFTYYDGYAGTDVTTQFEIQSPVDGNNYNGYSVAFDDTQSNGYFNVAGTSVTIGINGYSDMQEAVSALNIGSSSGGWKLLGTGSPYAPASVLTGAGRTVYNTPITAQPGDTLVLRSGLFSNLTETIKGFNWNDYLIGTTANGILAGYAKSNFLSAGDAAYFALKSGTTFTGKVNMAAPTATTAGINIGSINSTANLTNSGPGDVWIGTWQMAYKTANNTLIYGAATNATNVFGSPQIIDTTNASPALRVTQKGTGNVLLVEDALNPDTTALVVEQSGNVGIGVATGYTATAKLEVVGNTKSTTLSTGAGPTFSINSTTTHSGGSDTMDLLITINGVQYRIGLRPA